MVACELFERVHQIPAWRNTKAWLVEADFGYQTFFQHPTRSIFHNVAFGFSVGKGLARYFGLMGRLSVLSSIEDRNKDLDDRLVQVRLTAAAEFHKQWRYLTLYFAPGLELAGVPAHTVLTSPECKLFGTDHPRCDAADVKRIGGRALAGIIGGVGVRIRLSDELFMGIHAQSGIYLLPTNQKDKLDFPLAGQLSFGFHL